MLLPQHLIPPAPAHSWEFGVGNCEGMKTGTKFACFFILEGTRAGEEGDPLEKPN